MDKELIILDTIEKNKNVTQRELSKRVGLSLGSVNILINKMIHDGLIKITHIPVNRVLYMLTPKGIAEKVNKTYSYIKQHYNFISNTSDRIKNKVSQLVKEKKSVYVLIGEDELSEITKLAIQYIQGVHLIKDIKEEVIDENGIVLCTQMDKYEHIKEKYNYVHYLLEII